MSFTERTVKVNGISLHYLDWGPADAPPVVLLHGITGHARVWDHLAEHLVPRRRVLALDQRGHGDSDPAPDDDYRVAPMADDVAAFAGSLRLDRFALLGHSMGGRIAIQYAAAHAARLERLVIVDIGPDIANAGRARIGTAMAATPERFATPGQAFAWVRAGNARSTERSLQLRIDHGLRPTADGGFTWKYDRGIRDAIRSGQWRDPIDLWSAWGMIACPTLIIRGADSDVLSAGTAQRMTDMCAAAQLVEVAEAGHTVPGDQPERFLALVSDFLGRDGALRA